MKYGVRAPVAKGFNQFDGYASLVFFFPPPKKKKKSPDRRLGMQRMLHACEKSALQTTWGRNQGT